jgi:DNA-binding MarR family transcriptional regulator
VPADFASAPARLRSQPSWLVNQVALTATRLVTEGLASVGLRRHHYSLLATLDEVGPASQAELSRRTAIDRSDMVAAVNDLAEGGYVERSPDPDDRRRNVITLTPAGRRLLAQIDNLLADVQARLLAPLSPTDRTRLTTLLTRLATHHTPPPPPP